MILARHPNSLKVLDLDYPSITQAIKYNPHLVDWRYKDAR